MKPKERALTDTVVQGKKRTLSIMLIKHMQNDINQKRARRRVCNFSAFDNLLSQWHAALLSGRSEKGSTKTNR